MGIRRTSSPPLTAVGPGGACELSNRLCRSGKVHPDYPGIASGLDPYFIPSVISLDLEEHQIFSLSPKYIGPQEGLFESSFLLVSYSCILITVVSFLLIDLVEF